MDIQEWLGKENILGEDILKKKYMYQNETFDNWLCRISNNNQEVINLIKNKKFLFGGRICANRNLHKITGQKITYSNCYVVSKPQDNIESIFECAKKMARTFSYGGGVGVDIGNLRPKHSKVNNAAKESTGAVSFIQIYSDITGTISQNGRRGALMISIPCDHPDLDEFIDLKSDLSKATKANLSIRVTDEFMNCVKNDLDYKLRFTFEDGTSISKTVKAKDIFEKLCKANWTMAEPGLLYWDRIENYNLLSSNDDFKYGGVNPCAK